MQTTVLPAKSWSAVAPAFSAFRITRHAPAQPSFIRFTVDTRGKSWIVNATVDSRPRYIRDKAAGLRISADRTQWHILGASTGFIAR